MKRLLLISWLLCLTVAINAIGWKDAETGLWFDWTDNLKVTVHVIQAQNNEKYSGVYTIPSKINVKVSNNPAEDINDVPVVAIANRAFQNASGLTEVIIEADISYIDYSTFENSGLKSITLPSHLTIIGLNAFAKTALTSINIPASVNEIYGNAFGSCYKLQRATFANVESLCKIDFVDKNSNPLNCAHKLYWDGNEDEVAELVIPSEVTTIKPYTFINCTSLTSVTLEEGVTAIGENAFAGCNALKTVNIPSSLTDIAKDAFQNCSKLEKANFASELSLCSINYANLDASPLYKAKHLYIDNDEVTDAITIPTESLKDGNTIRAYILAGARYITRLNMPQSDIATHVEASAFLNCAFKEVNFNSDLQATTMDYDDNDANPFYSSTNANLLIKGETRISLTFTSNVKNNAFPNSKWLRSVTIAEGVESIGDGAFKNCINLTTVSLPSTLESIGEEAFNGCKILQGPKLPNSLKTINDRAFKSCQAFKEISIPNGCSIRAEAFNDCTNLLSVVLPNDLTTIYDKTFYKCFKLNTISIPNTVTDINAEAFYQCEKLLTLPLDNKNSQLTTIGDNAFYGCIGFTNLVIPDNVETILNGAFNGCKNITMLSLPSKIDYIGMQAFDGCEKLKNVYVLRNEPPQTTVESAFGEKDENDKFNMTLYLVPNASEAFNTTEPWMSFANKGAQGRFKLTFYIDDAVERKDSLDAGSVIPEGIKEWAKNPIAIDKAAGDSISPWSQAIPETMPSEDLDFYAYVSYRRPINKFIYHLEPAEKENGKKLIARATLIAVDTVSATKITKNDTKLIIPDTVQFKLKSYPVIAIGPNAFDKFKDKAQIISITLPKSQNFKEIGTAAFKGCKELGEVKNFEALKEVSDSAFANCSKLTSITLSDNVTKIGRLAFSGCSSLNMRDFPAKLDSIKYQAFANTALTQVTIGNNVKMDDEVFKGCSKLKTAAFAEGYNKPLPSLTFWGCSSLTTVTMSGTMDAIQQGAFKDCINLTSFEIPDGISQIGSEIFSGCSKLKKVIIPSSISIINDRSFFGCTSLKNITLPATIKNLGSKVFVGDTLTNITILCTDKAPEAYDDAFDKVAYDNANLYVINTSKYTDSPWNKFKKKYTTKNSKLTYIVDGDTENPYKELKIVMVGSSINPQGKPNTGKYAEEAYANREFSGWKGEPEVMPGEDVVVNGKFKYQFSFAYTDDSKQPADDKEFKLPKAKWYFYGDKIDIKALEDSLKWKEHDDSLASVIPTTMPPKDSLIKVKYKLAEQETTKDNIKYKVFLLEGRAEVIGNTITSPTSVVIPNKIEYEGHDYSVTTIQNNAFANNKLITGMSLPNTIDSIGIKAFYDNKFENIIIPAKVDKIGNEAFHQCTSLNTVTFESDENIKTLPFNLFRNCMAIESFIVPTSVTKIEKSVFAGCSNLKSITINSTTLPEAYESSFDETHYANAQLKVPENVTNLTDEPWTKFKYTFKGEESVGTQCKKPTIYYNKGKLEFECQTPDAEIVSRVVCSDANVKTANSVELYKIYTITAYARKTGMSNSDNAIATITWRNGKPLFSDNITVVNHDDPVTKKGDINEDGSITANDASLILQHVAKKHTENVTWDDENY